MTSCHVISNRRHVCFPSKNNIDSEMLLNLCSSSIDSTMSFLPQNSGLALTDSIVCLILKGKFRNFGYTAT